MRLYIANNGILYCGRVSELLEIMRSWPRSLTLKEYINASLQ